MDVADTPSLALVRTSNALPERHTLTSFGVYSYIYMTFASTTVVGLVLYLVFDI